MSRLYVRILSKPILIDIVEKGKTVYFQIVPESAMSVFWSESIYFSGGMSQKN